MKTGKYSFSRKFCLFTGIRLMGALLLVLMICPAVFADMYVTGTDSGTAAQSIFVFNDADNVWIRYSK